MKKKYLPLCSSLVILTICALSSVAYGQEESPIFSVERLVVGADVQNREPVGVAETFPTTTEKVYCFLKTTNIKEDTKVTFTWFYDGKELHSYEVPLKKGDRWRTYTYKNIFGQKGTWEVAVKDSTGKTVKTVSFTVE